MIAEFVWKCNLAIHVDTILLGAMYPFLELDKILLAFCWKSDAS